MPPDNILPLLHSLGWLAALMFAAVWPGLPGVLGARHAGWLIGFCATCLLSAAQSLVLPVGLEWRQLTCALGGVLLWEFARRVWNDAGRRRISAATHLLALECLALVVVVDATGGPGRPAWFFPIDLLYTVLPGLLGAASVWLLWFCLGHDPNPRRRSALRLALVGLGLFGFAAGTLNNLWDILPPWLAAAGLGVTCLSFPATRTRPALACALGLASVVILGPPAVSLALRQPVLTEHADLLARAERAALTLRGKSAAALAPDHLPAAVRESLRRQLETLHDTDPLLHRIALWHWADSRLKIADLASGAFIDARAATAVEEAAVARAKPFVIPADPANGRAFIVACAPLIPGQLENPTAWIALEFPEIVWATERDHSRRTGIALVGVLAAFCAMGFVLVTRQALENTQHLQLERSESASRAKTEFLAFLSHEMRTPLQTVVGRAELLRREIPATTRHADAIETQGRHLLRLVTDLLDLGTIEAGKLRLHPAPFALRPLLSSLDETHGPIAVQKGLTLILQVAPDIPDSFLGDESRLRQILGNLLDNAVKYTPHGTVTLQVYRDVAIVSPSSALLHSSPAATLDAQPAPISDASPTERLVFEITDTGPGLPPEKIPRLFTLFTRLDSGGTFTREGTGVGLALVRRLCDLLGGTVTAANRPAGGAVFTVHLNLIPARVSATSEISPSAPHAASPLQRRLLLAEDNSAARDYLTEALQALGHTVVAVPDGQAALAAARAQRFDAALLDINLPLLDGIALARLLRVEFPDLRLIGCSAEAATETRDAALAAGMHAFLAKPVSLAQLSHALTGTSLPTPFPITTPLTADIFAHLATPATVARARATFRAEWPQLRATAETALAAGEAGALIRLAHYIRTTALLLNDRALGELCTRVSSAAVPGSPENPRALLATLDSHFAAWPPSP